MVLTIDKIVKKVALRVGDRNFERSSEIRGYVEDTVTELTMLLRKGSVLKTATLSVSNNEAILPDNCFTVLKVFDSSPIFFDIVNNDDFRVRSENSSSIPTVQVFEDVPNWRLKFLNYTNSSSAITVDYLITSNNPALMPEYYESLILMGAVSKYHLNRSPQEKFLIHNNEYQQMKNEFKENQFYNENRQVVMKGDAQLEAIDPESSYRVNINNNYFHPGGYY